MLRSRMLCLVVILSLFPAYLREQDVHAQDDAIRLSANLVLLNAAVIGKDGNMIKTLAKEDFRVFENGVEQKIEHFLHTEAPFALMLLLDLSGSTRQEIEIMKSAAGTFLDHLRHDDRIGVIAFSREVEMIGEFTDSRSRVVAAIQGIASPEGSGGRLFSAQTGTSIYDALFLAVTESPLGKIEGRKAIVCMSDAVDSTSSYRYEDAAKEIEKADVSVYFLKLDTENETLEGLLKPRDDPGYINFSPNQLNRYYERFDPDSPDRHRPRGLISPLIKREINAGLYEIARQEVAELAERTGGRVYPVNSIGDLSGVYRQVADDLRSQYSLGYYPSNDARDGRWRSIRVEVRPRGAGVRSRSGYWAPAN